MSAIWAIHTLERNEEDGGVSGVYWRAIKLDGDYSATTHGYIELTPNPLAEDFIAYEALTEADVIGWVKAEVVEADVEAALAAEIAKQKLPEPGFGVPW